MVSVDELVVFAYALDLPPAMLLTPYPDREDCEILPKSERPSYLALDWLCGRDIPEWLANDYNEDGTDVDVDFWRDAASPARLVETHRTNLSIREGLARQMFSLMQEYAAQSSDTIRISDLPEVVQDRHNTIISLIKQQDELLINVRSQIHSRGYPLPELPHELKYLDQLSMAELQEGWPPIKLVLPTGSSRLNWSEKTVLPLDDDN